MTAAMTFGLWSAVCCWSAAAGATAFELSRRTPSPWLSRASRLLVLAGVLSLGVVLGWLWQTLGRPPLRTLGETRLWYAALLPAIGLLIEWRLGLPQMRIPMVSFGALFVGICLGNPETLDRTLMPALQSGWFVPHVTVYMIAYAALGLGCGAALWALGARALRRETPRAEDLDLPLLLVRIGLPFLTFGLLFGALWAKEAWGHYWTWDPKETWAFMTWACYVAILHAAPAGRLAAGRHLALIGGSFAVVLACWFLLNHLPAANLSVHTYTR